MAASGVGGSTIIGVVIGGGATLGSASSAAAPTSRAVSNAAPVYGPPLTGGGGDVTTDAAAAGASTFGSGALAQAEAAAANLVGTLPHTGASDVMVLAGCGVVALVAGFLCLGLARRRADAAEPAFAS